MYNKEIVKELRKVVIEDAPSGGLKQRINLLAYGYARGIPYRAMERTINEDKLPPEGRATFFQYIYFSIAYRVADVISPELVKAPPTSEENKERWRRIDELKPLVLEWINKPLEEKEERAA
jgi:hypothetical protein